MSLALCLTLLSTFVSLSESAVTTDGSLHMTQQPAAEYNETTKQWHIALTCGNFTTEPHFDLQWDTPSGHSLPSSSYADGEFKLLLPNPVAGGPYTCRVPDTPALLASVTVDRVEARLELLEAHKDSLAQQVERLQQVNVRQVRGHQDQLDQLNKNVGRLSRRHESLNNTLDDFINVRNVQQVRSHQDQLDHLNEETIQLSQETRSLNNSLNEIINVRNLQVRGHQEQLDQLFKKTTQLSRENESLNNSLHVLLNGDGRRGPAVSFTAAGLRNTTPAFYDTLVFSGVVVNQGDGYNSSTGVFTAPVSGTYFFAASLVGWGAGRNVAVYLMLDLIVEGYVQADFDAAGHHGAASLQAVVKVRAGQQVSLRSRYDAQAQYSYLAAANVFTGFLISQDP